ncbi:MAG: stage II sporulation protein P [Syntrophomonadaceae bacterium]|jgi:stage II sporulation protein P
MSRTVFAFLKGIVLVNVFILVLIIGVSFSLNHKNANQISDWQIGNLLKPFSTLIINETMGNNLFKETSVLLAGDIDNDLLSKSYIGAKVPENIMLLNMQALALGEKVVSRAKEIPQDLSEPDLPVAQVGEQQERDTGAKRYDIFNNCRVVFYCTHSAESYIPDSGKGRLDGEKGLINQVAREIASHLENRGLEAIFYDTIHDNPYQESYVKSRETVKKALATEKKNLALFDIHRDSIPGQKTAGTVTINGKKSAQILIIVGTDARKNHPHWKKNLDFAERLFIQGEKMYPGLIRGTRTKDGTYHQELHDHALLLEVGTDYNSLAEALYAAQLFADVLVEVLKDEI